MKLIIVESPNKVKTIQSFLDKKEYTVMASVGHCLTIANVGKYQLGIDVDSTFNIKYIVDPSKEDVVKKLKMVSKQADTVIFATDGDREGYLIALHLKDILKIPDNEAQRVVFNEITQKCVIAALANPIDFNKRYADSAELRHGIDRIIGFRISSVLYQYTGGRSAGRVQSAALSILCNREKEIQDFKPETYYEVLLDYMTPNSNNTFTAKYIGSTNKKIDRIKTKDTVDKVLIECVPGNYLVKDIRSKQRIVQSKPPFTTSTFQQECSSKLGYAPKVAMDCAQRLYEGIELDNGEHSGLITYMRTDSSRMDPDFKKMLYGYIKKNYGNEYLGVVKESKSKSKEQDAHECLRCVNLAFTPKFISSFISDEKVLKVYKLIYDRTVASAMADCVMTDVEIILNNNKYMFSTVGHFIHFDGFKKIYTYKDDSDDEYSFPQINIGDMVNDIKLYYNTKQTQPPKRYSEAGLVKAMEDSGIGRPSTYANCISILKDKTRNYTQIVNKSMQPTDHGMRVNNYLQEHFSDILSIEYTAKMESILDAVADGSASKIDNLRNFYETLDNNINILRKNALTIAAKPVGRDCPECGRQLVYKTSKKGNEFIGCSGYPNCKHVEWINDEPQKPQTQINAVCPNCGKPLVTRINKRTGSEFIGCSGYPNCKYLSNINKAAKLTTDTYLQNNVYDKD